LLAAALLFTGIGALIRKPLDQARCYSLLKAS
jgi:putative ABC transport system permease protein